MFNFKETDTYREMFGEGAVAVRPEMKRNGEEPEPPVPTTQTKRKINSKIQSTAYAYSYPRLFGVARQVIGFLLLLAVLPYSLLFEIRLFWWNYASIPESFRQPTWGDVQNSIIGGVVKFAETGGARRAGQDLYTANDLVRLLIHWVLVLAIILFVFGFFNTIEVTPAYMRIRYAGRWRKLKWENITQIRTVELQSGRLIVLVQGRGWGLSIIHRCYSLLLGAGWQKGIIITSDIQNFDNLVQYLIFYKSQKLKLTQEQTNQNLNPVELFVEDGFVSPALQGTLEPAELMDDVIDEFPPTQGTTLRWPTVEERSELLPKMSAVALIVPALYLTGTLLKWAHPTLGLLPATLLLFGLGLVEWFFASYIIYENGRQFALLSCWKDALVAYPHLQGVRIVAGLVALILTVVLTPGWLVFLIMAVASIWGAVLTTIFTARLYDFSIGKAALAGAGVLVYQALFLACYNLVS